MQKVALTTSTIPSTIQDPNAHNHLPLPGGGTIGSVSTEDLRRRLAKLGVEKAWTRPKNEIVDAYRAILKRIHDESGNAAVEAWIEQHKV